MNNPEENEKKAAEIDEKAALATEIKVLKNTEQRLNELFSNSSTMDQANKVLDELNTVIARLGDLQFVPQKK